MIRRTALTALAAAAAASVLWSAELRATSEPFEAPTAGTWQIDQIDGAPTIPSFEGRLPHLTLTEDGRIAGSSGCNRFMGQITVEADARVEIGPLASTMMACSDPLMAQEQALFAALESAQAAGLVSEGVLQMLSGGRVVLRGTPIPDPDAE
ncbi:META domain-containing protein [Histidinibacterium lentulum]|uniref:META domain-containing protein n=1 Tax=Histidinibacterium lentulum TaxID=2480588 RepID=A0A3N2R7J5_9RHOB|nr:META domain-containing protein [Histidinibacterium lentulum]ROU03373.1 META domain-containing protein [Histidinibacterium lentulum]